MVSIEFYFIGNRSFAVGQKTDKLVNGTEGADPAAEKSSQDYCKYDRHQSP
jgi:hypothetical protein